MNIERGYRIGPGPFPVLYSAEALRETNPFTGTCKTIEQYEEEYKLTQQPDRDPTIRAFEALVYEFGQPFSAFGLTKDGEGCYSYVDRICVGRARRPGDLNIMTREQLLELEAKWDELGKSCERGRQIKNIFDKASSIEGQAEKVDWGRVVQRIEHEQEKRREKARKDTEEGRTMLKYNYRTKQYQAARPDEEIPDFNRPPGDYDHPPWRRPSP